MRFCDAEQIEINQKEWTESRCVVPPVVIPEIDIPQSFIFEDAIETFEVSEISETKIYLSQILGKEIENNKFIRIIIKDLTKRQVIELKDFMEIFGAKFPEGLYDKLDPDFTLFIYSQKAGKRIGFITKITNQERFVEIVRLWEDTMENDLNEFFTFFGKKEKPIRDYFAATNYSSGTIRCQTYTLEDFGSCYAIDKDYFILTTSIESMQKTIDKTK